MGDRITAPRPPACAPPHTHTPCVPRAVWTEVEALFAIRCTNGAVEPAVLVRPMHLGKKLKTGCMPRLRPTGRPREIVPLAALIERLKVARQFVPADPPLRARRPRRTARGAGARTVPRSEPGPAGRDWLATQGSAVLIPFGSRSRRRHATSELEHELGDDLESASTSESDHDETASEMFD